MRWLKNLLKQPWIISLGSWCIAHYMRLVFKTNVWTRDDWEILERYWKNQKPFIACFWHNRLLMQTYFWESSTPFHMVISAHRDGRLIAKTISHFGIKTIVGSSSRGGTQALREILAALKQGECVGITPDGPRGPRFIAREGIVQIARLANLDIVPCAYSTSRRKVWNSWDRFVFALPFGRGAMVVGEPIKPPRSKEEFEKVRQLVEKGLQDVSDRADALCGHVPLR